MNEHLFHQLREQMDRAKELTANDPKHIRITDLIPEGVMFVAPVNKDGTVPAMDSGRTLDDGGPREILMHPADLMRMIEDAWRTKIEPEMRRKGKNSQEIQAAKRRAFIESDGCRWRLFGIPIVDAVKVRDLFRP